MNNQKRFLSQVLSLDAWHDPIKTETGSSVYVELSFQEGRLGGDSSDFPFTFNIALRRALLTIEVEKPLTIDRASVARSIPTNQGELTRIFDSRNNARNNGELKGRLSPASLHISASGSSHLENQVTREEKLKIVQDIPRIIAVPKPGGPNSYAWELTPSYEEVLDGQPWHPVDEPRFTINPVDIKSKIAPSVKIILSCLLEDINITDLQLKNSSTISLIKEMALNKMNIAAAVQHLKISLKDMQLEAGSLDDRFSRLIIADILASQS